MDCDVVDLKIPLTSLPCVFIRICINYSFTWGKALITAGVHLAISSRHVCDADLNCLIPLSRIFTFFVKYSRMLIYISFTDIFSWWTPFSRSYELPTCRLCVNRMSGVTVNVQTTDQLSTRLSSKTFSPSSAGYSQGREADKLSAEIWKSTPGLVSQIPDFGP